MKRLNKIDKAFNPKYNITIGKDFITYHLIAKGEFNDPKQKPLYIAEVIGSLPEDYDEDIVVIDLLFVAKENRRQGIATRLVDLVINQNKGRIILVLAGPTELEFHDEPTEQEYKQFFKMAEKFYEGVGFKSYNHIVEYEQYVAYILSETNIFEDETIMTWG